MPGIKIRSQQWLARLGVTPGRGIIKDTASFIIIIIEPCLFISFCLLNSFWFGRKTERYHAKDDT